MKADKRLIFRWLGGLGALVCVSLFIHAPSFPTPDKLFIFLLLVFIAFGQGWQLFKHLFPFAAIILVYESFRSLADKLNTHTNYTLAPHFDKWLFGGNLPTAKLQSWLWHGRTSWYDIALYIPYLLFFVIPFGLAILVWKTREAAYWRVVSTYLVVFFGGFLTFLLFPAAPPWLASQNHVIEPISRVSSSVWYSLGIHDFPSVYNHLSPNPVAAVPSLHSASATLLALFCFELYGRRWGLVSLIYPAMIYFGVVYEGEHYVFDVLVGVVYAFAGYYLTPFLLKRTRPQLKRLKSAYSSSTKTALRLRR